MRFVRHGSGREGELPSRRFARGATTFLALADQAVVSATSLLTTILVGRFCGSEGLGYFSLALSVLLLTIGIQVSLVSTPYTIFRTRSKRGSPSSIRSGAALASATVLSVIVTTIGVGIATAFSLVESSSTVVALAWTLVFVIPCLLGREFARRFDFAHFRMGGALLLDAAVATLQISLLVFLGLQARLTSPLAVGILGLSSGLAFALWLFCRRGEFKLARPETMEIIRHDWWFGRWLVADHITCIVQMYVVYWLLLFMMGVEQTGVLTAAASIAAIANPLLQGAGNVLAPKFSAVVAQRSRYATGRLYWTATVLLAIPVLSFTAFVVVFGKQLLDLLYQDQGFSANGGAVVAILAIRLAVAIPTIAADHAVVALENTRAGAIATFVGLVATVGIAIPCILAWDVLGAALALLAGTVVESFALLWMFASSFRRWEWSESGSSKKLQFPA